MTPTSFSDADLEQILAEAATLRPDQRDELLRRVTAALAHGDYCSEGAVQRAIVLATAVMGGCTRH
jgi:hypothetical protein